MSRVKDAFHDEIEKMPEQVETLTPTAFINFLEGICTYNIKKPNPKIPIFSDEKAASDVYKDIADYIRLWKSGEYHG
jgi:hypothetical protein